MIVTTKDADEILNLLELVVGAAVMCNDADMRSDFIQKIFSLDHSSQVPSHFFPKDQGADIISVLDLFEGFNSVCDVPCSRYRGR